MTGLFITALFVGWIFATIWAGLGWFLWCEGWRHKFYLKMVVAVFFWVVDLLVYGWFIYTAYHLFMLP